MVFTGQELDCRNGRGAHITNCYYEVEGEGTPVIFIHGVGVSLNTWDGVVTQLTSSFRCVRYDLRGHARSPKLTLPYTLHDLVADLEELREELGIARTHLVGHSLGGMIAPAYALLYPERVLSLGLLSTAAGRTEEESAKVIALVEAMENKGVEPLLDQLVERWFTPEFVERRGDVVAARRRQVLESDVGVFLNVFRIYAETELGPRLSQVQAPALVMTGEFDGGCNPRINRFIASELPNAELDILSNLRHAILLEAPERVVPVLASFLHKHNNVL
jgi:pimeloyl-ACP methyl ester carboxylesterase